MNLRGFEHPLTCFEHFMVLNSTRLECRLIPIIQKYWKRNQSLSHDLNQLMITFVQKLRIPFKAGHFVLLAIIS